jgi:hypothetical protein
MLAAWAALLRLRARSEQPPLWIRFAAFGIVVLDLGVATLRLNPTAPADLLRTWRPRLLVPLAREPEPLRLHVLVPTDEWRQAHAVQHPAGLTGAPVSALGQFEMLSPPIAARWGVDGSFSGEFTGQERRELLEVKQLLNYNLGSQLGRRILMIGGVSHVISVEPMPYPGLERIYSIETIYDTPIHLFRVAERLPRAYAVSGRVIAQPPATYALFGDYSFDPRASVILPRGPARPARDDFSSRVTLLWRRSASVGIEAELSHDGVVVLLEGWYPGWTASVDGTPAPVLRANALFRAVEVPAGQHRVEFQYRPSGVSWGTWLTLGTLVSIGSWAGLRSAGRHRRRGAVAAPAAPAKAGDPGGSDT